MLKYLDAFCVFINHCVHSSKKGNQKLGMIMRTISSRTREVILPLYKHIVRPNLDYCVPVWRPHYEKDLNMLEKVQRRVTKLIDELKDLSYEERLKELNLTTIKTRYLRADLLKTFKIVRGFEDINPSTFFTFSNRQSRNHKYKLTKSYNKYDVRKYAFSQRVINEWNNLPDYVVNADSINTFKGHLERNFKKIRGYYKSFEFFPVNF